MKHHAFSFGLLVTTAVLTGGCSANHEGAPRATAEAQSEHQPSTPAPEPKTEAPRKAAKSALTQTKFGQLVADAPKTELASIAADPAQFAGQTVQTEGVVKAVCKAAGCWMEIEDASGRAHVKMANHSFYVPKNADGHRALVQGTVQGGAPKDECGAKDSCGGEGNGALAKLEIEATGVEFLD